MFLSAFARINADPASRTDYARQRARGKTHTQALLRLAPQRISVLFAMLPQFLAPRTTARALYSARDVEHWITQRRVSPGPAA
ncbi:hypothetical protein GA0115259_109193 [Streptomyces sp. MnatMP-M17]|nr:hypothetical protein GA0115259_109193 [Streptomyces sp. MnatMP-M17]